MTEDPNLAPAKTSFVPSGADPLLLRWGHTVTEDLRHAYAGNLDELTKVQEQRAISGISYMISKRLFETGGVTRRTYPCLSSIAPNGTTCEYTVGLEILTPMEEVAGEDFLTYFDGRIPEAQRAREQVDFMFTSGVIRAELHRKLLAVISDHWRKPA